jgi:acyl-CoA synthetase (AMP-forming)/AMP-acid ligase II/acyl carrier protein
MLITNYLERQAELYPLKKAFVFTEDGENESASVTFVQLLQAVRVLSASLTGRNNGAPALLIYENALEFATAFFACQHAGITAVPMFFPKSKRHFERLELVIRDSGSQLVLCEKDRLANITKGFEQVVGEGLHFIPTSVAESATSSIATFEANTDNPLSFIQYTSGSTGLPKGVVVTHENLLHNQLLIKDTFGCNEHSVIMSWLPFYHDMGLVGNLVHAIYNGCTCVLMSPYTFMQNPVKWFTAISTWKVTHTGGPNFAYDLCTERITLEQTENINLSSWEIAYNGSEPVNQHTLEQFGKKFSTLGFNENALFPCYGLAEATLLVSGGRYTGKQYPVTCCGSIPGGIELVIIDTTTGKSCPENIPGEICVHSKSVTPGYWKKDNNDLFITYEGKKYLKTGDTGYLHNAQLFVTGRIKEMIIVHGENHFPYDIERSVFEKVQQIEPNGVIAFSDNRGEERLVIVAEIKREHLREESQKPLVDKIELAVISENQVTPYDIVLVKSRQLPRTSSGKLQRVKCRDLYLGGKLEPVWSKLYAPATGQNQSSITQRLAEEIKTGEHPALVHLYLEMLITAKTGINAGQISKIETVELTEIGIDSIKAMEIINVINKDLEINLDASSVFQKNTYNWLVENIENLLWLKSKKTGEEVII